MQSTQEKNALKIGGIEYSELVKKFGTPLYVYDADRIVAIASAFVDSLRENYGDGLICYASKAFCCKAIYRLLSVLDIGADVVSGGELFTAIKANFPVNKTVFHGNNKSEEELFAAVKAGVKFVVVDSFQELDALDEICFKLGKKQDILIRVNVGIEAHTHKFIQTATPDSKFGFSLDNGDAVSVIKYAGVKKNLSLKGLHSHIGSQIFGVKSFLLAVEKLSAFYKSVKDKLSLNFSVLNLGGGFGINYTEKDKVFTAQDYYETVKTIARKVKNEFNSLKLDKPYLILEPGRAIVGEAGTTLYTVGAVKEITGIKNYLSVDGGMFENPRFALYQAKYSVLYAKDLTATPTKKYTVAGKCCESGDMIAEDVFLPETEKGDILAVKSTGAYHYSMASNYNRNTVPAVVFVKDGKTKLVVKRQTYKDIIKNDL